MSHTKRTLALFAFYDHLAIEKHLTKMAEQGWMLEKPGNFLWKFRKAAPKKLHFSVTYFPNASEFDPGPTEEQQIFEDYCARDGWRRVCQWGAMQIFCNELEYPTPIETDVLSQVETVHRAMKKNVLLPHLLILTIYAFSTFTSVQRLQHDPADFLSNPSTLNLALMFVILLLTSLRSVWHYFHWYKKAREKAEADGAFLPVRTQYFESILLLFSTFLLLGTLPGFSSRNLRLFLCGVVITTPVLLLMRPLTTWLKKKGVSKLVNLAISYVLILAVVLVCTGGLVLYLVQGGTFFDPGVVDTYEWRGHTFRIYNDPLPLNIEDLIEPEDVRWSKEAQINETFLVKKAEYRQDPVISDAETAPDLKYSIIDFKVSWLYSFCKNAMVRNTRDLPELRDYYTPADSSAWEADEVYQAYFSTGFLHDYIVCWENRILNIRFDWEPTPEQIQTVVKTFKPER